MYLQVKKSELTEKNQYGRSGSKHLKKPAGENENRSVIQRNFWVENSDGSFTWVNGNPDPRVYEDTGVKRKRGYFCFKKSSNVFRKYQETENDENIGINSTSDYMKMEHDSLLPLLTSSTKIKEAGKEDYVKLARGMHSMKEYESVLKNKSAGGRKVNPNVAAPTTEMVVATVGMDETIPLIDQESREKRKNWVEYTNDLNIAEQFNRGGIVIVKIKKKYLTEGSISENGWVIRDEAPVTILYSNPESRQYTFL